MKTAIIGSREFNNYDHLAECLDGHIVPITQVVSGGDPGTGSLVEQYARAKNLPVHIFKPDGLEAPNIQILENCEQVITFISLSSISPGTAATIKEAQKRNIAVFNFYPI